MKNLFDAFISYGRADSKAFATNLHKRLTEQGLKVFDQNDFPLGIEFQNQIDDWIEHSHNFLFIITPHSVKSPYCLKEIELAIKRNKRIIPLLHVEPSDCWDKIHPTIGKINWFYFRENQDNFETYFAGLVSIIRKHADYVEQHTQFLLKALEWERNQKQTNYLLIGEERVQAESWLKIRFKDEHPPCIPTDLHAQFICESTKNAHNLMTQVFLAHSDKDRAVVEKVGKSLMLEGFTIWTNRTDIKTGTEFQNEIYQGIEGADNLVYFISPDSIQSKYCQDELEHAFNHKKRIIPILIEPTNLEEIPLQLQALQFIDFTNYQDEENYQISVGELLKQLKQDAHYYEQHKILLVKALKWARKNRNPSMLLRGYNLQQAQAWLKVGKQRREHPSIPLHEEFIAESLRQPSDSSLEVFVSYSRADSDFARKLNEALQIQGKTTWFDQESIASGSDFQQEIYRGIENSDNFLFIISPKSVNSPYCADEVEYAQKLNKRFVAVVHREVSPQELHPALAKVQWIDFNQQNEDFSANFSELVRTLDTDREHVKSHTKWSQRALEWEDKGRDDSFLLRGSNLQEAQRWLQEWLLNGALKQPEPTTLQTEYLLESYKAETEQIRVEQARQKVEFERQKAQIKFQKIALGGVSLALLIACGLGIAAFFEYQKAEIARKEAEIDQEAQINSVSRFSLKLSDSDTDRKFDALIEAIRAGSQLQKRPNEVQPETRSLILTALQAAVYGNGFRESDRLTQHTSTVFSVSFSPDGKTIATASGDGTIKLWGLNGQELQTLKADGYGVYSVSFSPDGQTLASAGGDHTIKLWSKEGKLLHILKGHEDSVSSVRFSPDGQTLASVSDDKTVKLWSKEGKFLQTFKGHKKGVRNLSFSPDGQTLASVGDDNTIKLWSKEGKLLQTLKGHQDSVSSVSFSPDGNIIASGSDDKTIKLWSKEGKLLQTLKGHEAPVSNIRFSSDGNIIASGSDDNTVKLWSKEGKLLQTLNGHEAPVWSLSFSPDDQTLASASADNTVKLWRKSDQTLQTLKEYEASVWSVVWNPDGQTVAASGADNTVKLWNKDGALLHTFQGHKAAISSVRFSPDGQTIATASDDKTVRLWSKDGKLLHTFQGHTAPVWSVSFSPDGNIIASGSADKTIILWNKNGTRSLSLNGHKGTVRSVSFSPDGTLIASGSTQKIIRLWSQEGKLLHILRGHTDEVTSVVWSPDGQTLASGSADNTIKLWSKEGQLLYTFTGHKDRVFSVSFSPDGQTLASASGDKTIKLWTKDGKPLQTLIGHDWQVNSVSFSPDGKMLASASDDKTVRLWNLADLQLDKLMQKACNQVGDYLKYNAQESDRTLCDGTQTK